MNKYSLSRNMGFITGPLLLAMGLLSYNRHSVPVALSMTMVALGVIRIGLTLYSLFLSKKDNNESQAD